MFTKGDVKLLSAVILAAGEAKRMGRLKQLLPWGDSTILETVINNLLGCTTIDDQLRIVIGAEADRIKNILHKWNDPRLQIVINHNYQVGMLSSIRCGINDLPQSTEYILFTLGDKPLITTKIFDKIIHILMKKRPEILVPVYKGKRGHPVIISSKLLGEINQLTGPGGLRGLIKKYPKKVYRHPVMAEEIIIDIDYYREYKKYRDELS